MDRPRSPDLAFRLFGAKPEHTLALLRAAWPSAVGEELARRTRLVALDAGVLRVMVKDVGWQRSLLRMRGDILARLRKVAGRAAPRALGFVTGVVPAPEPAAPAPAPPAFVPPPAAVADAARAIPDAELRTAFVEAAGRYLARFGAAQAGTAGVPGSGTGGGSASSS
jgi:hypothetical protein